MTKEKQTTSMSYAKLFISSGYKHADLMNKRIAYIINTCNGVD